MFFRVSALLVPVLALSSLVVAEPESVAARGGEKGCSNGTQQCCKNSYQVRPAVSSFSFFVNGSLIHTYFIRRPTKRTPKNWASLPPSRAPSWPASAPPTPVVVSPMDLTATTSSFAAPRPHWYVFLDRVSFFTCLYTCIGRW